MFFIVVCKIWMYVGKGYAKSKSKNLYYSTFYSVYSHHERDKGQQKGDTEIHKHCSSVWSNQSEKDKRFIFNWQTLSPINVHDM